jgi:hypothetical protein
MLTLYVDAARWRLHQKSVVADLPGLVPVAKGNGYGFGVTRLAAEAAALGKDTLAVGTCAEAREVAASGQTFQRLVVLTPYLPGHPTGGLPANAVHTVASLAGLRDLDGRRVVIECRTSLRRHGIGLPALRQLAELLDTVTFEGFALHLPLDRPRGVDPPGEVAAWVESLAEAGLPTSTVYVSHLSGAEVAGLGKRFPGTTFRARVGTRLWLDDRDAFEARGRVLEVVRVSRGERFGYRQRRAPRLGHVVVVGGGTAHGVGLEAPKALTGGVQRAKVAAIAGLATVNRTLSPFRWAGKQRWFAEPPHMLVSLLWLPASVSPPAVGDELPVDVRMTTTHFDAVVET